MRISYWSSDVCSSDLEDRGIGARQFPRAEERRPIDIFAQIGQIPIVENMQARQLGRGRLERHIGGKAACARLLDRQQPVLPLALARLAYRILLRRDLRDITLALGVADQRRGNPSRTARLAHLPPPPKIGPRPPPPRA